jgi:hypothetical protein
VLGLSAIPRLYDGVTDTLYLNQADLLANLKRTSIGMSSSLHMWDSRLERFVQSGIMQGRTRDLVVDAKDEVVTQRCACRTVSFSFIDD